MTQTAVKPKVRTNPQLAEPPMFRVIYINDNQTPMEFVIGTLIEHFEYNETTAEQVTMEIHTNGAAVVAILPYEIAEQKGIEITVSARSEGFPLQIKLEPATA